MPHHPKLLKLNQRLIDLSEPIVMGILNVTPDSFYKGNRFVTDRGILQQAEKMLADGATIIDIGGYSTRPNAENVSQDEEIKRISDALGIILKKFPDTLISVDTFRSAVANTLIRNFGVAMINDISGGTIDDLMFETIASFDVAYVLMHMRGTPQTMQTFTNYGDVASEVLSYTEKKLMQLRLLGVKDVVIDPGFGFAKTVEQNYLLLQKLTLFQSLNAPVLAGISRKSMLYRPLGLTPEDALNATTAANMLALTGGASILRVHDVKEAKEAITIYNLYKEKPVSI